MPWSSTDVVRDWRLVPCAARTPSEAVRPVVKQLTRKAPTQPTKPTGLMKTSRHGFPISIPGGQLVRCREISGVREKGRRKKTFHSILFYLSSRSNTHRGRQSQNLVCHARNASAHWPEDVRRKFNRQSERTERARRSNKEDGKRNAASGRDQQGCLADLQVSTALQCMYPSSPVPAKYAGVYRVVGTAGRGRRVCAWRRVGGCRRELTGAI